MSLKVANWEKWKMRAIITAYSDCATTNDDKDHKTVCVGGAIITVVVCALVRFQCHFVQLVLICTAM